MCASHCSFVTDVNVNPPIRRDRQMPGGRKRHAAAERQGTHRSRYVLVSRANRGQSLGVIALLAAIAATVVLVIAVRGV